MPNIKPISDLRNYSEVLRDVAVGAPVFLTKNGRGRYAIVDMHDYEKTQATLRLMNELAKGRKSGEEKGWLTLEAVEEYLGIIHESFCTCPTRRKMTFRTLRTISQRIWKIRRRQSPR